MNTELHINSVVFIFFSFHYLKTASLFLLIFLNLKMSSTAPPFCMHLEYHFFFHLVCLSHYYGIRMPNTHYGFCLGKTLVMIVLWPFRAQVYLKLRICVRWSARSKIYSSALSWTWSDKWWWVSLFTISSVHWTCDLFSFPVSFNLIRGARLVHLPSFSHLLTTFFLIKWRISNLNVLYYNVPVFFIVNLPPFLLIAGAVQAFPHSSATIFHSWTATHSYLSKPGPRYCQLCNGFMIWINIHLAFGWHHQIHSYLLPSR